MSHLMSLTKKELVLLVENNQKVSQKYADELIAKGGEIVGLHDEIKDLRRRIDNRDYNHKQDLMKHEKEISTLTATLDRERKGRSQIITAINVAIDTVAAMNYPYIDINYIPNPESSVEVDEQFHMLRHFKQLVSTRSQPVFPGFRS